MQKLKFGVIGCSKIAESSVIPAIIKSNYSELKIVGSRSKQKAESLIKEAKDDVKFTEASASLARAITRLKVAQRKRKHRDGI